MKPIRFLLLSALAIPCIHGADTAIPHLRQQGTATQLIVGGKPLLMRGGEIGNSTATNPAYLQQFWPKFAALNLNTLLVPVYWDLIEPEESRFDFSTVDQLLEQARAHQMRLVLLWFGSWKNSMSCYAPAWVKREPEPWSTRPERTAASAILRRAASAALPRARRAGKDVISHATKRARPRRAARCVSRAGSPPARGRNRADNAH